MKLNAIHHQPWIAKYTSHTTDKLTIHHKRFLQMQRSCSQISLTQAWASSHSTQPRHCTVYSASFAGCACSPGMHIQPQTPAGSRSPALHIATIMNRHWVVESSVRASQINHLCRILPTKVSSSSRSCVYLESFQCNLHVMKLWC